MPSLINKTRSLFYMEVDWNDQSCFEFLFVFLVSTMLIIHQHTTSSSQGVCVYYCSTYYKAVRVGTITKLFASGQWA